MISISPSGEHEVCCGTVQQYIFFHMIIVSCVIHKSLENSLLLYVVVPIIRGSWSNFVFLVPKFVGSRPFLGTTDRPKFHGFIASTMHDF